MQAITDHLVRITPYVHNSKDQVLVFFGTLSNLHELCARHHEFSSRGKSVLDPSAASGTGAQTTTCLLRMYQHFAGKEVMMLAELQVRCWHVRVSDARMPACVTRAGSQHRHCVRRQFKMDFVHLATHHALRRGSTHSSCTTP